MARSPNADLENIFSRGRLVRPSCAQSTPPSPRVVVSNGTSRCKGALAAGLSPVRNGIDFRRACPAICLRKGIIPHGAALTFLASFTAVLNAGCPRGGVSTDVSLSFAMRIVLSATCVAFASVFAYYSAANFFYSLASSLRASNRG